MNAKNIMIYNIETEYTSNYIANVLWKREIALVSSITLIPQIKNEGISYIAYIDIHSYCDTESAFEFIEYMKRDYFFFAHDNIDTENSLWIIKKNTHNSGDICVGSYTTKFMPEFFLEAEDNVEQNDLLLNEEEEDSSENNGSLPSDWDDDSEWIPVPEEIQTTGTKKLIQWMREIGLVKLDDIEKLPLRRQVAMTDEEISNLSNL